MIISKILDLSIEKGASDVIIVSNTYPYLKIDGEIEESKDFGVFSHNDLKKELSQMLNDNQKEDFEKNMELDLSLDFSETSRFRVNIFKHKKGIGLVFRIIKNTLPSFEELMLPSHVLKFIERRNGLILITGAVGTGKSTTMSILVDYINSKYKKHIITVEDPIEYLFENKKSLIEQRDVGVNTQSFENGLKYALRQASDVIMLGEMRDLETFRLALRAAETGNLVIATLHTAGASRTVSRIIDMFPGEEKEQIRQQLSESLIAVMWQDLLKRKDGKGRVPAIEILVNNTNVSNIIRRAQDHQLNNAIETGKESGMIPMKKSLDLLYEKGYIYEDDYSAYITYLGRIDESI